jgi:uncharacterized protein YrrD
MKRLCNHQRHGEMEMWLCFSAMQGLSVMAQDEAAGSLVDILVNDVNWRAQYFVVEAGAWFFRRSFLIEVEALASIDYDRGVISLQLSRSQLEESEELSEDPPVSLQHRLRRDRAVGWVPIWPAAKMSDVSLTAKAGVPRPFLGDPHLRSLDELLGYELSTTEGGVGRVDDHLIESGYFVLRYLVVRLGSWLSARTTLVSTDWVEKVSWEHQRVTIDVAADLLEEGPSFRGADQLDETAETLLYNHYGRERP